MWAQIAIAVDEVELVERAAWTREHKRRDDGRPSAGRELDQLTAYGAELLTRVES